VVRALEPVARQRAIRRYRSGPLRTTYADSAEAVRAGELARAWWYYSVELVPGVVTEGQFPPDVPMLPRLMLRRCAVEGRSCLDIGTMEGVVPTLLAKRGARVLAVDYANHCLGKLDAVKHYHGVEFDFRSVGLMYRLHRQLRPGGFDVVNCSGLLYHVFSPLSVLASVRPLVKRGGIVIVSTNVTLDPEPVLEFNVAGRLQPEANTFWYASASLLDYLLRYLRLEPIDCLFCPHAEYGPEYALDKPSGYLSVACRAVDDAGDDPWMESAPSSWEYLGLSDWKLADQQDVSDIGYDAPAGGRRIDLRETIEREKPIRRPVAEQDSHLLRLSATA
jgi:2-polyprenyl-3-methyl-5-hydroxy-6-metoxy-1,4-benzoquinol methylase